MRFKRQGIVEIATHVQKMVAGRVTADPLVALQYDLRMLGV